MPRGYVEPEVFLQHGETSVYHTYRDGDIEEPCINWFCLHESCADECCHPRGEKCSKFDVRTLATYREVIEEVYLQQEEAGKDPEPLWIGWHEPREEWLREAIIRAVNRGLLLPPEF